MQNYQRFAIGAFVIIAAALISFGVYNRYLKRVSQEETQETTPMPSPQEGFPIGETSPPPAVSLPPVQPESGTDTNLNIGIKIIEPENGAVITSPLAVKGLANVNGGIVAIKVVDLNGKVLGRSNVFGCMGENFCPFEASISFVKPQTPAGFIEVESASGDNLPQFLQRLQVSF